MILLLRITGHKISYWAQELITGKESAHVSAIDDPIEPYTYH